LINFNNWDGTGAGTNLTKINFPDGDGFTGLTIVPENTANGAAAHVWQVGAYFMNLTATNGIIGAGNVSSAYINIGQLTYNITEGTHYPGSSNKGINDTAVVQLMNVANATLTNPAIVIFEEQDDSSSQLYNAIIVNVEGAGVSAASDGVSDIEFSWGKDAQFDETQVKSDTDLYKSADFWGTISTTDQSDTDSYVATISYPDEQVFAQLYIGEVGSSITGGVAGGGSVVSLGNVWFTDTEASRFTGKNLIVIGGSCVNRLASDLLGGAGCGPSFTDATGVGSGEFLIETFSRSDDKVATLVAGYNMEDTRNAAKVLTTGTIDTTAGKKYTSTSATTVQEATA